jgi:hypothetical protein
MARAMYLHYGSIVFEKPREHVPSDAQTVNINSLHQQIYYRCATFSEVNDQLDSSFLISQSNMDYTIVTRTTGVV